MRLIMRVSVVAALLLGSATLAPSPALAAAPVLSGAYIFSVSSNCQAVLAVTKNADGQVTHVNINQGGNLNGVAGTITFTPATGRAVLSGTNVDGPLLLMKGVNANNTLTQRSLSEDWAYSNTSTTLILNGITYRGAYGKRSGGIVQQFTVVGREEGNRCVLSGTFIHK